MVLQSKVFLKPDTQIMNFSKKIKIGLNICHFQYYKIKINSLALYAQEKKNIYLVVILFIKYF